MTLPNETNKINENQIHENDNLLSKGLEQEEGIADFNNAADNDSEQKIKDLTKQLMLNLADNENLLKNRKNDI